MTNIKFCYPLNLPHTVTQKFGENYDYYSKLGMKGHNGWDFGVVIGTPVYSCNDGVVHFSAIDGTMSDTIMIDSNETMVYDGNTVQLRTIYAHLSELLVNAGDVIKKGQLIGKSGNTGRYTTGPHLHFGIHPIKDGQDLLLDNGYNGCIDPRPFWDGTFPKEYNKPISTKFLPMQQAILDFQLEQGINDFKDKPLNTVLYGNKTKLAADKFR